MPASRPTSCAAASTTASNRNVTKNENAKPRSSLRGFSFAVYRLSRRLGGCEGRHLRGKFVKPRDQLRMTVAPGTTETKISVAERTSQCDLPNVGHGGERRRRLLQSRQAARDLVGLTIDPRLHFHLCRPVAAFVNQQ